MPEAESGRYLVTPQRFIRPCGSGLTHARATAKKKASKDLRRARANEQFSILLFLFLWPACLTRNVSLPQEDSTSARTDIVTVRVDGDEIPACNKRHEKADILLRTQSTQRVILLNVISCASTHTLDTQILCTWMRGPCCSTIDSGVGIRGNKPSNTDSRPWSMGSIFYSYSADYHKAPLSLHSILIFLLSIHSTHCSIYSAKCATQPPDLSNSSTIPIPPLQPPPPLQHHTVSPPTTSVSKTSSPTKKPPSPASAPALPPFPPAKPVSSTRSRQIRLLLPRHHGGSGWAVRFWGRGGRRDRLIWHDSIMACWLAVYWCIAFACVHDESMYWECAYTYVYIYISYRWTSIYGCIYLCARIWLLEFRVESVLFFFFFLSTVMGLWTKSMDHNVKLWRFRERV